MCARMAVKGRFKAMSSPSRRMDSKRTLNATSHVGEPTPDVGGSGDAVCEGRLLDDDELSALSGDLARRGELTGDSGREGPEAPRTLRTGPNVPLGDVMVAML